MSTFDFSKQHAYIVVGIKEKVQQYLIDNLQQVGLPIHGHPDFFIHDAISFGVDHARNVQFFLSEKPTAQKKIVIIASTFFTTEAQNALLKTIEEPSVDTCIFFITDSVVRLLPTIRSRMVVHALNTQNPFIEEAQMLLSQTKPERLLYITSFIEKYHDEENQNHVREAVYALCGTCVKEYHVSLTKKGTNQLTKESIKIFEKLMDIHNSILDNGSPVKMLAETFVLLIPNPF